MASQPQPLRPAVPCASATGTRLVAGSPETGNARPKPPVRPKPRVLPKPAVPAKPTLPQPPPGPRRPELPSAEKMNRLAGPQPYGSGGSAGGPLRRPSFTLRSPETPNGKGHPAPPAAAVEELGPAPGEEVPPALPTPSRKGPAPFKVTPVPVATKPERFPGTTVEEILAKMDSREGPGSPDRARLSPFCSEPSPRFGSRTFAAFRRRPGGEADGAARGEAPRTPQPAVGEPGTGDDGCPTAETSSGSPRAGPSCAGDPRGCRLPPSPPDLSSVQPGAFGPPGSPRPPACPAPAPGAPFQPAEPSAPAPGSPEAPLQLLAPGSPTVAPGSPQSPARPLAGGSLPAPGAPSSAAEPHLGASRAPGSPHTPGEGSPNTASPPGTPELPPRTTCPPGSPEAAAEHLAPPSPPPTKASCPPGSPEGPDDPPVSLQPPKDPDSSPTLPFRDSGLRRSSEGVLQPPGAGQGLGELGGSLSTLPRPGDPLPEPSLGGQSSWSLSQSFEWTFPSRGVRQPVSPPRSPIVETDDSGLSEEGEDLVPGPPCSRGGDSASDGSGGAEGAPCPGGPVAQRETEGSAEEEEEEKGEEEQGATVPCSPLCVSEPSQDPAEPEPAAQPSLVDSSPLDSDTAAGSASAWLPSGDGPASLQGPGGPCHAEGPPRDRSTHADPVWLAELLASPGHRGSPEAAGTEDLLGWSRKDLCQEFGIGRAHRTGSFDWPGETEQDREFGTKPSWDSAHHSGDGDRQDGPFHAAGRDWGSSGYGGTELTGEARLGCGDWPESPGTGGSCLQGPDLSTSKPAWGTGYGVGSTGGREEVSTGKGDWSRRHSVGHGQQRDEEPSFGQPSWASGYGPGDLESQDREITPAWAGAETKDTPDWASKYCSRDTGTKDKDFTLGWAGRSSTGDTGSPEKELSPGRPAWDSRYTTRDMERQDREFSPSRPAWTGEHSTGDWESQDQEFSPSRPAWDGRYSTREVESQDGDMGTQDREFSPSRPAWTGEHSPGDWESQDQEFKSGRPAEAIEHSTRDRETWDGEIKPSRLAWDDRYSTRDVESQDRDAESQEQEFSPSRAPWASGDSSADTEKRDQELGGPSRLSWAGEHGAGHAELGDAAGAEQGDLLGAGAPGAPAQEAGWGSTHRQQPGAMESRAWPRELTGAVCHNQFGVIGTERVPDHPSAGMSPGASMSWDGGTRSGGLEEPLAAWHGDLSFGSTGATSCLGTSDASVAGPGQPWAPGQPHGAALEEPGWSAEPRDAEAKRREWASAYGARCAARSWDIGAGEQSPGGDASPADGDICLVDPSNALAAPTDMEPPCCEPPNPTEEERDPLETPSPTGEEKDPAETAISTEERDPPETAISTEEERDAPETAISTEEERDPPETAISTEEERDPPETAISTEEERDPPETAISTEEERDPPETRSSSEEERDPPETAISSEEERDPPETPSSSEEERDPPETPSSTEEERDPPETPLSPGTSLGAADRTLPDTEREGAPLDHLDGERPPSQGEKRLSLGTPQPATPMGQEFAFLEDTEILDSSMYRTKASLGRKRRHRAPALRPGATAEGDAWIFRDSTEPRPAHPAVSSDEEEEAAEQPKSRRVRASPSGRGVKVPLFPGLSAATLKAKLRGRNRSAEEGSAPGDSKGTPPKDPPHVQRSKSCKIPGLGGKPPALPPKPDKSSGSEASPPHWLQALKLKKKKP